MERVELPHTDAGEPVHYESWGEGDPVIALHPLALDSSAFAGVGEALAAHGLRTLAVDLPGFGRTPAPDGPLTPARLAAPVLELARSLPTPPLLIGMSLGGRVALEVALTDPQAVRGVVLIAPYLPWRRWRGAMGLARLLQPSWGEYIPLERAWPLLKRLAESLESRSELEHDWLARASVRVVYYSSCPATRKAFFSASRELALDPAEGPESVWTRLPHLKVPATFLWAGRDALIPSAHASEVHRELPTAAHIEAPCAGHFVSGTHFRCMRHAITLAVTRTCAGDTSGGRTLAPCLADSYGAGEEGIEQIQALASMGVDLDVSEGELE